MLLNTIAGYLNILYPGLGCRSIECFGAVQVGYIRTFNCKAMFSLGQPVLSGALPLVPPGSLLFVCVFWAVGLSAAWTTADYHADPEELCVYPE